jgi:hypothetical protein
LWFDELIDAVMGAVLSRIIYVGAVVCMGAENGGGGRSVRFRIHPTFSYLPLSVFNLHSTPTGRAGDIQNKAYRTGCTGVRDAVKP